MYLTSCLQVTACSFGVAAIWQYESLRKIVQQANCKKNERIDHFGKAGSFRQRVSSKEMGIVSVR